MKLSYFILAAIVALSYAPHGKCKRKKINLDKLAKEWNDEEEDEAWHEDTHEWKRKMNDKNKKPLNIKDIETMGREDLLAMSQHNNNGGVMAMTFAQLKPGVCTKRECTGCRTSPLLYRHTSAQYPYKGNMYIGGYLGNLNG